LSADPICTWHGVVCNEDFESVLEVTLPHHLLQGTIPREFFDGAAMPFLTTVDLTGNQIQGGLPQVTRERETVGQQLGVEPLQTQLRVLKLGQNLITGNLNQLMGLTRLKDVDISQNQITGPLPDSIVDLKHLGTYRELCMHVLIWFWQVKKMNFASGAHAPPPCTVHSLLKQQRDLTSAIIRSQVDSLHNWENLSS
jgi:Leucine Rich repeat